MQQGSLTWMIASLVAMSPLCAITTATWNTSDHNALWNDTANWDFGTGPTAYYPGELPTGGAQYKAVFPSGAVGKYVSVTAPLNIAQIHFQDDYTIAGTAAGAFLHMGNLTGALGETSWIRFEGDVLFDIPFAAESLTGYTFFFPSAHTETFAQTMDVTDVTDGMVSGTGALLIEDESLFENVTLMGEGLNLELAGGSDWEVDALSTLSLGDITGVLTSISNAGSLTAD